jgi:hypothetical protein
MFILLIWLYNQRHSANRNLCLGANILVVCIVDGGVGCKYLVKYHFIKIENYYSI